MCVAFPEEDEISVTNEAHGVEKKWAFDKVFTPDKGQAAIFEDVSALVVSMLDGFNVCVFAYGQTGSGKTHSMQGSPSDPGIYRRTFKEFFTVVADRGQDWKYALACSVI